MKALRWVLFLWCFPTALLAHELFNWQKGDFATYVSDFNHAEVTSSVINTFGHWAYIKNFAGMGNQWVFRGNTRGLYLYRSGKNHQLPDASFSIGSSTLVSLGGCQNEVTVTLHAKELQVTTKAGIFNNVIELHFSGSQCSDAGIQRVWLAKDVGVIQWESSTIRGPETFELNAASIGGEDYPKVQGISVTANMPGPILSLEETSSNPLKASMTITNHTEQTLHYEFNSSARFDIVIVDSEGEIKQRWSDDQLFLTVMGSEYIAPGKSLTFGGLITLDETLISGQYFVRFELTAIGHHAPSVTVPLLLE